MSDAAPKCINGPEGCAGHVKLRPSIGESAPPDQWCDSHWAGRLEYAIQNVTEEIGGAFNAARDTMEAHLDLTLHEVDLLNFLISAGGMFFRDCHGLNDVLAEHHDGDLRIVNRQLIRPGLLPDDWESVDEKQRAATDFVRSLNTLNADLGTRWRSKLITATETGAQRGLYEWFEVSRYSDEIADQLDTYLSENGEQGAP
ncbi:hypothetical protein [Saccharopolyspora shandongensis]|uniref:hypothetical protein n=1 Tax=Saccharopolyspora shandongensis TaxID=418495 RepID=UPI00340DB1B5